MRRVLVIGGRGRIGSLVVEACRRIGDLEVRVGGRTAVRGQTVAVDLGNPDTFGILENFDTVIDCADTSHVSPESCLKYCLEAGRTFIETSAFPGVIQRLLTTFRSFDAVTPRQGLAVLGLGLFPGVSNVAAHSLCAHGCKRLELAVRMNPFSGSGRGTADLMTQLLFSDAVCYEAGRRVEKRPFTVEVDFPFTSGVERAMLIGLPESSMLNASLAVPSTGAYLAPDPSALRFLLRFTRKVMPTSPRYRRLLMMAIGPCMTLIRAKLLNSRTTAVEISVLRDRLEADGHPTSLMVRFSDGLFATGFAVGAALAVLLRRPPAPGIYLPDEVLSLRELLDEMSRLAGSDLKIAITPSGY